MKNLFTVNHIINYFFAVITICISIYAIEGQIKEVDPTFITEKNTQQILSKELLSKAPLKISTSNGEEINSNIYSQTFYFFNQGRETITKEKVLEPLFLSLSDTSSKILDFKTIKSSRSVIRGSLKLDSSNTKLFIDFDLLEEDDGIAGQIIYTSENEEVPSLILNGTVAGAPKGFSTYYKNKTGVTGSIFEWILIILGYSLTFLIIIGLTFLPWWAYDKVTGKKGISQFLTGNYQLIIRNRDNYSEKTTLSFTYPKLTMISMIMFSAIFVISLILSRTLLEKWVDPRYKRYEGTVVIPGTLERNPQKN